MGMFTSTWIDRRTIRYDLAGGLSAGVVALPLALAFGVASGLGPAAGLYGAIAESDLFRVACGRISASYGW